MQTRLSSLIIPYHPLSSFYPFHENPRTPVTVGRGELPSNEVSTASIINFIFIPSSSQFEDNGRIGGAHDQQRQQVGEDQITKQKKVQPKPWISSLSSSVDKHRTLLVK